jgi:cytoskeletal protein RodZ
MESFGAYLKEVREQKGKSLEDLSESTKIAITNLESLERDRYDLLPPRVFVKGFVRSYAQEVGLSPEETIMKFDQRTQAAGVPESVEDSVVFSAQPSSFIYSKWFTIVLTAAGGVSICILLLTFTVRVVMKDSISSLKKTRPAISSASNSDYPGPKVVTAAPRETRTDGSAGAKTAILEIKALANTWLRVEPDGGPAEELIMSPGDTLVFKARESFSLQTGNAGGLRLKLNNREIPPLGKANQSLSITLP